MIRSNQQHFRTPQFEVLGQDQRDAIYGAALEMLEVTGMRVAHDEALQILADHGAFVEGNVVRFPTYLVEEAIRTAPSRILMYDRKGEKAMRLEGTHPYFGAGSDCPRILDSYTGETRRFLRSDIAKAAQLADALPNLDFHMSLGLIWDEEVNISDLCQFQEMLFNTTKPIVFTSHDARGHADIQKMAEMIAGGEKELRQKPFVISYIEPSSPLDASKQAIDKVFLCAEKHTPMLFTPCPSAGSTAPVTVAGTVAQALAECLGGVVLSQLVSKGTPVVVGGVISAMDMKTTAYLYGGPDFHLMTAAIVELAHHIGLPVYGTAGCSDSNVVDEQAAIETTLSISLQALAGGHLIHDVGYIGSGLIGSFDMMVMSDEVIGLARRILDGINTDEEHMAVDLIHKVGPRGNYLREQHTFEHFKKEHWYPDMLDRRNLEKWAADGRKTHGQRVNEKTRRLLKEHEPEPLPEKLRQEVLDFIESEGATRQVRY